MFKKLLIANRGEIACRIMRTAERLGIATAAVYSDADADALHVEMADEAHRLGPAPASESYLHLERVMRLAQEVGADALHPGYGFLAESSQLASCCEDAGITFIGPPAAVVRAMGSKAEAKRWATEVGIAVVPGYFGDDQSDERLREEAERAGYPVLVKAALGGGGRGMRVAESREAISLALEGARREALSAFGDDRLLIERYLDHPRHIEVQVFADTHGNCVHLFERDCSAQRRHQKIVEEAPAPALADVLRRQLGDAAVRLASAIGYVGAGTVEFLVRDDEFFFMEMNTRLQVEHPVTELITGTDLVEWQLRIAAGEALPLAQGEILRSGHAVEVRLYCEDPENDYLPSAGSLDALELPERPGIRVDSGVRPGDEVTPYYDAMIAKIIAHGDDRAMALGRLGVALGHTVVGGVTTNLGFLSALITDDAFVRGGVDTRFVSTWTSGTALAFQPQWKWDVVAALAVLVERHAHRPAHVPWRTLDAFRMNLAPVERVLLVRDGERVEVRAGPSNDGLRLGWELSWEGGKVAGSVREDAGLVREDARLARTEAVMLTGLIDAEPFAVHGVVQGDALELVWRGWRRTYALTFDHGALEADAGGGSLASPMPGQVVKLFVDVGDEVDAGAPLIVVEAMKMEHTISAPARGRVEEVFYSVGDKVDEGVELVHLVLEI